MRFYQLEYLPKEGQLVANNNGADWVFTPVREWFGSERDAVVRRLDLFKAGKLAGKKSDHPIEAVDVPTDKANLLVWLNRECA